MPSSLQLTHTHIQHAQTHTYTARTHRIHTHTRARRRRLKTKAAQDTAYKHIAHTCTHAGTHMQAQTHAAHTCVWRQTMKDNGKIDPASRTVLRYWFPLLPPSVCFNGSAVDKLSQIRHSIDCRNAIKEVKRQFLTSTRQQQAVHFIIKKTLNSNIAPTGISTHSQVILKIQRPYNSERKHVNNTVWWIMSIEFTTRLQFVAKM